MKRPTRRARSPASAGASEVNRRGAWDVVLIALTVALGAQVVRVLFPLAYGFGETTSFATAGVLALAVSLGPLLAAPMARALGPVVSLTASVGALLLLRLTMQVVRPIPLWLAAGGTAVAFVAWTVQFLRATGRGSHCFVIGLIAGLALDVALRSGFWTWDYAWQDGPGPSFRASS